MYQNNQPLGAQQRGGGGGWRALSFMSNTKQQPKGLTAAEQSMMDATAGPQTVTGALNWYDQMRSQLGLGNTAAGPMGNRNAFKGYTAGTGAGNTKASQNSY